MLRSFTSRMVGAAQRTNSAVTASAVRLFSATSTASQVATPTSSTASPSTPSSSSSSSDSQISLLRNQLKYYAVAEIKNRPYLITKNDIIVLDRLKDVQLGDVIELNQIKELGSKDYAIQGAPYVSSEYYSIKATVIEQPKGKIVETFKKKRRKHFQRRYHIKPLHTLLRVSELEVKA
ncbi:MAG: ribosomal protein L21-like protein [Linnemannia elongata]|nr:MAG: ribosomal protein L21-like protein [Linnemannia elongata]